MIVRYVGDRILADCEALCVELRDKEGRIRSPATIRKYCTPVATDPATGRKLFDVQQSKDALKDLKSRSPHRRRRS